MRNLFIGLLLLVVGPELIAQNYSSQDPAYITAVSNGERNLLAENYDSCLVYYAEAFQIRQTSVLSTLRAAACAHAAGRSELRDVYLDTAFTLNASNSQGIYKRYEEFDFLRGTEFENLIDARFLAAYPDYDAELAAELAEIRETDQRERRQMRAVSQEHGFQSAQMDSLWKLQSYSDSVNTARIIEIFEERGYPGASIVGDQANAAFLVIQHADLEIQEKYFDLITGAADDGEVPWRSVALLVDRVRMRQGKAQKYGSQVRRDSVTNAYYFAPIENPTKIDSIRATVGLGPLQDYADNWNFTWDPEQHLARRKQDD